MAENDASREALASFDIVSYAGAALPDDLGDRLTNESSVNLLSIYGTTEVRLPFLLLLSMSGLIWW